jgi:hypothetical protein
MTRPSCLGSAAVLFCCMAVGCGGAASMAPTKTPAAPESEAPAPPEEEPQTIEEAQAAIARARAELEGQRHDLDASASSKTTDAPAQPQGDAPPAREERRPGAGAACRASCRALASMKRAVEALCRMAGDADERCTEARRKLEDSTARVAQCGCG